MRYRLGYVQPLRHYHAMFPRIRKILSVRQLLVLALAAIIAPFWIINYEEWLKTRKLDQVLIETDKAVSEPGFWDSVMASWDSIFGAILKIANSEYVIGGLVAVLVYAFAPLPMRLWRHFFATGNPDKEAAPIAERQYVSPFAGKTSVAPETIPQRFIDIIDGDDRGIAGRIRLHAIPKPIRVHRHLDAPDPYIDITVHLRNDSVFDLEYQSAQGRFHYQNHPLQNEPESLNPGVILTRDQAANSLSTLAKLDGR